MMYPIKSDNGVIVGKKYDRKKNKNFVLVFQKTEKAVE